MVKRGFLEAWVLLLCCLIHEVHADEATCNGCGKGTYCCPMSKTCCSELAYSEELRTMEMAKFSPVQAMLDYRVMFVGFIICCLPFVFCCLDMLYNCLCSIDQPIDSCANSEASSQTVDVSSVEMNAQEISSNNHHYHCDQKKVANLLNTEHSASQSVPDSSESSSKSSKVFKNVQLSQSTSEVSTPEKDRVNVYLCQCHKARIEM